MSAAINVIIVKGLKDGGTQTEVEQWHVSHEARVEISRGTLNKVLYLIIWIITNVKDHKSKSWKK